MSSSAYNVIPNQQKRHIGLLLLSPLRMYFYKAIALMHENHRNSAWVSADMGPGLTFLWQPCGQGLPFLRVGPWQDAQNFLNTPPARPGKQLRQAHTERGVTAVHVRHVRGILFSHRRERRLCGKGQRRGAAWLRLWGQPWVTWLAFEAETQSPKTACSNAELSGSNIEILSLISTYSSPVYSCLALFLAAKGSLSSFLQYIFNWRIITWQ